MTAKTKDQIYTGFTIIVILSVLVLGIINWVPVLRRYSSLKEKEAEIDAEIEEIKRENSEYTEMIRRFQTSPEQVESVARQQYRVYPGEVVYVFPDNDKK